MKNRTAKIIALFLAAVLVFGLAACGKKAAPAPSPEPSIPPSAEPSEKPEAPVETVPAAATPDPDSPAGRAAAKGLPAPPDIDITSREFIFNNSYNSIKEYELANGYGSIGGQGADKDAIPAIQELLKDAQEAGLNAYISAGYRNIYWLLNHYNQHVSELGMGAEVAKVFLGPGVNEHQTGFAFDFTDDVAYSGTYVEYDAAGIENTELYAWLCEHCTEYGLILRYPEGKEDYYGTACSCAAHFRYVGVEAATYIMENDLCFEEFLLLYDPDAVYVPKK